MKRTALVSLLALAALAGCASLKVQPVDYSWSFESVLSADADGFVRGEPKTIAFDAGALFRAEQGEKASAAGGTVRVIRDAAGYYYVTSPGFRHVYIFAPAEGRLVLEKKVLIAEEGMGQPFFNRREGGIELGADGRVYLLTKKGIVTGGKK